MNIPIFRETITLTNLSTTTISVSAIVPFDKCRVHLATTLRFLQCQRNLLVSAKDRSILYPLDSSFLANLMHRRIRLDLQR